jgi:hypothetical protein
VLFETARWPSWTTCRRESSDFEQERARPQLLAAGPRPAGHCLGQDSLTATTSWTEVRDNSRHEHSRYALVTSQDLSKHVGERVEIKGKAVTNGDGKVSVESKTKTEVENGQDQETKTKSEGTTGAFDVPFLGVRSMKTLSSSCN